MEHRTAAEAYRQQGVNLGQSMVDVAELKSFHFRVIFVAAGADVEDFLLAHLEIS